MGDPKKAAKPTRTDVRFDFVDKLARHVPPVEMPPTSMFPFPPPVGPGTATYYFPITALKKCDPTGVFFPMGYAFPETINAIVYFHGHKQGAFTTINQYWGSGNKHGIRLREDINESGKQVVLIAPTMGEFPGSVPNPDMGVFRDPGGADGFLAEVARWIGKYVPQYATKKVTPSIGKIVLAGHSGAGAILSQQVKTMKSHICEVWGFDSMYGQGDGADKKPIPVVENWRDAAAKSQTTTVEIEALFGLFPFPRLKPATHFFFHWAGGSPGANADKLEKLVRDKLSNVKIEFTPHVSGNHHFETITRNFKKRVAAASCF